MPEYIYPIGSFSRIIYRGYGARLYGGLDNLFIENMSAGIEAGFLRLDRKKEGSGYFILVPLSLNMKYSYYFYKAFFIVPELNIGPAYLSYRSNDRAYSKDYDKNKIEMMSQAGIKIGKKINGGIGIALSAGYGMIFEKKGNMDFLAFNLGAFMLF